MNKPSEVASSSPRHFAFLRNTLLVLAVLITGSAYADEDPPSRIARLAYLSGDVTFAPAGDNDWNQASINRPLTTGDRLLTEDNARAAMDIDGGDLRIGDNTGFNFLNLDDRGTQIELSRGTLSWRVDSIADGQNNEVDTPTLAFVIKQPGTYKIAVADDGSVTTITIQQGAGTVYGEGGASYPISGRQSWRFSDSTLNDIVGSSIARADDFDLWCNDRDSRSRNTASSNYVSTEVVGYNDLADNGDWDNVAEYGNVWYPRTVAVGWAPYRNGHWAWVAPWGWTWIDDAPWGFAPFHYGRWVYVSNRWGWVPGPRNVRPVYCPAMVAFVGGSGWSVSASSGQPIGWVPLGPRDVYRPWYRGSQRYFTNVNVTNVININRTHINNDYNDYHRNRGGNGRYMNQSVPGGMTVVTRDSFTGGRPVYGAQVRVDHGQLERAPSMQRNDLPAGRPGVGLQASGSNRLPSQEFTRPPISFRKPPQASLGVRDGNRSEQPLNNSGRPGWKGGNNTPDQRGNNNVPNNGAGAGRPAQRDTDNNAPQQATQRPDNDPRWNRNGQRNDDQRQGAMPSSRFSPWGNRGDARNPQQNNVPVQPSQQQQTPQPRENDPRWNGNAQRNDDQRQDNAPQSRAPTWGTSRGNTVTPPASQQNSAPAQPQQTAPVQQPDQPRNNGWNFNNRRGDSAPNPTQQQIQQPQAEQSNGRSQPRFGSSRPAQNTPPTEQPNAVQAPAAAPQQQQQAQAQQQQQQQQPQRGAEQRSPLQQNRGPMQNRPEHQPRPEREPRQREPAEPRN